MNPLNFNGSSNPDELTQDVMTLASILQQYSWSERELRIVGLDADQIRKWTLGLKLLTDEPI